MKNKKEIHISKFWIKPVSVVLILIIMAGIGYTLFNNSETDSVLNKFNRLQQQETEILEGLLKLQNEEHGYINTTTSSTGLLNKETLDWIDRYKKKIKESERFFIDFSEFNSKNKKILEANNIGTIKLEIRYNAYQETGKQELLRINNLLIDSETVER